MFLIHMYVQCMLKPETFLFYIFEFMIHVYAKCKEISQVYLKTCFCDSEKMLQK